MRPCLNNTKKSEPDNIYSCFLSTNPPATAATASPPISQTETPVSARFDDVFSGFLLEVDDDVVTEVPEDEESADGVVGVVGVTDIGSLTTPK